MFKIRYGRPEDAALVAAVEAECFPAAEAATAAELGERLKYYGSHFWLLFDGDKLVGFADGMATDNPDLEDEMYADASLHSESGAWQMIFGLNTIPAYRRQGCAAMLLNAIAEDARRQGAAA